MPVDVRRLDGLQRRLLHWRFLLFQRHRHNRLVLEMVAGVPILVLPQVLNPVLFRTGAFLAQVLAGSFDVARGHGDGSGLAVSNSPPNLAISTLGPTPIPLGSVVLDLGTGSGVGAVFAARQARRVVAVDINPEAVRCAGINVLLNRLEERVEVLEGDLFGPVVGQRFDVVVFNPPFRQGEPETPLEQALWSTGLKERFAAELADHLTPAGYALLLLSSDGDEAGWLQSLRDNGLSHQVIASRALPGEVLRVYRVSPA